MLISKIIIFKRLEKIYGHGKNAMGQLRSAVIPYSLSIVFAHTDGLGNGTSFDMAKVWLNEGLEDDLAEYFRNLMLLVNELIKKYSASDDYGEYSKKQELWDAIKGSSEVERFMATDNHSRVLKKYSTMTEKESKQV